MKRKNRPIVKIQIELTNPDSPTAMIYDRNRTFCFVSEASPELIKAMKDRPKAFFYMDLTDDEALVDLNSEAHWQNW